MKRKTIIYAFTAIVTICFIAVIACNKNPFMAPGPSVGFGMASTLNIATINTRIFAVPVALTQPVNKDVTIVFSVSSPTGARNGVQYKLPSDSVTIPAGQTFSNALQIEFDSTQYASNRRDTLVFTITGNNAGLPVLGETKSFTLNVGHNCPYIPATYSGNLAVIKDPWADFIQNGYTNATFSVINDSTLAFVSPVKSPEGAYHTIIVNVNTSTLELTVRQQAYGNDGGGVDWTIESTGGAALNYISPCNQTINLNLTYLKASTSGGTYPIVFQGL